MKFETKYDVGQTVYDKALRIETIIQQIDVSATGNEIVPIYKCVRMNNDDRVYKYKEEELAMLRPKPGTVDDLAAGDSYWIIDHQGVVSSRHINDNPDCLSRVLDAVSQGNVFLTEEEAEEEVRYRVIRHELELMAKGYTFKGGKENYYLVYKPRMNIIDYFCTAVMTPEVIYFPTRAEAEKAVEAIGHTRLMREYFKIKLD